jgi:alkaline phosphatase
MLDGSIIMKKSTIWITVLLVFILTAVSFCAGDAPKNIIIMISDGCGYNHITAAAIYQYGNSQSPLYARFKLSCGMATFAAGGSYEPNLAWSSFNYVKHGYTDSAAAATAMSTGVKTYNGAIGVDLDKRPLTHIIERCEQLGKATGVITTVPLSHATPAGFVAHNPSRDNYKQIAREMLLESAVDCIMGCGNPFYDDDGKPRQKPNSFKYVGGKSTWNSLVAGTAGADADADGINDPWTLIQTRAEFLKLADGSTPKRVCGIPQVWQTLQQARSDDEKADPYVVPLTKTVPTLEEMTKAAINVLDDDPDGFFLMIEGGAVDWANHHNQSGRMLEEQIDFDKAVKAVTEWVDKKSNWDESLLIVTADHECGYLTGPDSGDRANGSVWNKLVNNGKDKLPGMEWHSGGHTNSLVPFYANGSGTKFFKAAAVNTDPVRGPYIDNTTIAKTLFELLESSKEIYLPTASAN